MGTAWLFLLLKELGVLNTRFQGQPPPLLSQPAPGAHACIGERHVSACVYLFAAQGMCVCVCVGGAFSEWVPFGSVGDEAARSGHSPFTD